MSDDDLGSSQELTEEDVQLIREMYNCRKRYREETKVLPHVSFKKDWYENVVNFVDQNYYVKNNESHKSQLVLNFMKFLKSAEIEHLETFLEEKNLTVTMPPSKAILKYYKAGNITKEEIRQVNSFGIALKQVFVQNMIILFDLKRQVFGASKLEACEVFGMPVD